MQYGVVFPQTEIGSDPIVIRDYAQAAEELGYGYLLAYDHVLGANPERPGGWSGPYTHRETFHEVFTLFAYLAGITSRIGLATGVLILPQRQTALVAKQSAQVDVFSGGRLRLGIGIGWNQVEYAALDEDFTNRGKRSEEQIHVLRELWTKPLVTFQGAYHTIPDAGLNSLPVQRPIPIWIGGGADVVLERVAQLGDGWMANTRSEEQARQMVAKLHTYLEAVGRHPEDCGIDVRIPWREEQTPDERAAAITFWRGLGATHLGINTMGAGLASPQAHIDAIRRFAAELS
ncbi:MAG: LLM class F420-dependent oxidoreductase [Anaerolineaceae bacterium]|nr:LLM class F420-dependent oxidoreductase [Anaerolineaceae bacterium]